MNRYKKKGCSYCEGEAKADLYPIRPEEKNDYFYCLICPECKDPIIIYKYHDEPSDAEIEHMTDWGMKAFKYRIPDFERRHVADHFSIEMRPDVNTKQITRRKIVFMCPLCKAFFPSNDMIKSKEGIFVCRSCIVNLPDKSFKDYIGETNRSIAEEDWKPKQEAQYEHIQINDMDDSAEEGGGD